MAGEAFFVTSAIFASFACRKTWFTATNTSFGEPWRAAASCTSGTTLPCRKFSETAMVLLRYFTSLSS
jgi:hypothetical protein